MRGFARRLWLLPASGAYAVVLVLLRGRPSLGSDTGVFLSVAESLVRGDRLYVDIVDNKDPLFYYSDAAALAVLGWTGPFLLDAVWVAVAAASVVLLLRAVGASMLIVAVGFVTYPLLLTGAWYISGDSELAALAFAPLIGWLWIRGSFGLAGGLFAVGLLFKVNLALVLASAPLAFLLIRLPAGSVRVQLARTAAGFGAVIAAAAAILALRGELHGYINNLTSNVAYSHEVLPATGRTSGIIGHIKVAAGGISQQPLHFAVFAAAFILAGLLAIRTLRGMGRTSERPAHGAGAVGCASTARAARRALAMLFLCSTVATVVTLALTAAWTQHDEVLAFPGLMLIALVAALIAGGAPELPRSIAACAAAVLGVALLGGTAASMSSSGGLPVSAWFRAARSQTADSLERAATDRFPGLHEITFAHLGGGDEEGVAAFLDSRFVLSCPVIGEYVFTPNLPTVLRCITEKKPRLVLVTPSFTNIRRAPPAWNEFVARGSSLLGNEYELVLMGRRTRAFAGTEETGEGSTAVWALRGGLQARGGTQRLAIVPGR
jgi:hypothetical protein